MMRTATIIGGGVGGLGTAIGLAGQGFAVTVVERDPTSTVDDGAEAFLEWERPGVPQFRQPHGFSARSRNLLLAHAPGVVDRLRADGIEEVNFFRLLAPESMWSDEDDAYTSFWARRPAFELALRREAESVAAITILSPMAVSGLVFEGSRPLRVTGVDLADGRRLTSDVVVDCGGRRTPVPRWLADAGIAIPEVEQDCDTVYYTRYFRRQPDSRLHLAMLTGIAGELDGIMCLGFPGDHGTYGICFAAMPDDRDMRILKHNWAWEAVAKNIPSVVPWIDPANGVPLHDVAVMASHNNVRRQYVSGGEPLVLGLLAVGDALCATNPVFGWGASMALTYAFQAVGVIADHVEEPRVMALAYDAMAGPEADAVYRESAAMDRARIYRWRNQEVPDWDRSEVERQELISCIIRGSTRDEVLGRAFLRRAGLLESPTSVLDDPEVVAHAENTRRILASKPPRKIGPTREEILAIFAAAATVNA
ncbi:MAG: FAD-dependent oxidoreductase [Acidimicrobiales bacterium]